jgi:hypothetical protein
MAARPPHQQTAQVRRGPVGQSLALVPCGQEPQQEGFQAFRRPGVRVVREADRT